MKYIWEEADIRFGDFICQDSEHPEQDWGGRLNSNVGWATNNSYMVGMSNILGYYYNNEFINTIYLMRLSDGATVNFDSKTSLLQFLNEEGKDFIPMPLEWLVLAAKYQRGNKQD